MPTTPADLDLVARSVSFRPTEAELRAFTDAMPTAKQTSYGNVNVQTKVVSRSKASTYIVTDTPEQHSDQTISRDEGARIARLQDGYIAGRDMVVVDGFVGHGGPLRTAARLIIERDNANIAGMQRHLYYDPVSGDAPHNPGLTIIYTPNLSVPGYPNDRMIAVWLEEGVTRVINSDYFGESKRAACGCGTSASTTRGGLRCTPGAR